MSEEMSKSAKKRAAAKARAANAAAEAEPAAPAPEPKAKAKAEAKAKPKADAKPKAEPKAEPKAKAKGEAKPKAEPKPEPKAEAKPAAKAAGKASSKKKAAPAPAPEPPKPKEVENNSHLQMDDGLGGEWETATAVSKKNQKRKERQLEEQKLTKLEKQTEKLNQTIPGMAAPQASAIAGAGKVSQAVTAKVEPAKAGEPAAKEGEAPKEKLDTLNIRVPEAKIGRVIGPKGANLKLITEKTGIDRIDTNGETFTVSGKPGTTAAAMAALTELVEKGYMSLAFENFSEIGCMAHPSTFPDIIGAKGAVIIKLKEELKVEVNIPPVPKGTTGPKKYKIGIAGSKEASEKAQKCIEDIIMYGHSDITHPGVVHEELEVPAWAYAFIIGKGGSELRHIQKNWSVKVNIPREHSENPNVVVVGEPRDVARAKEYIEKQVANAGTQTSGRESADKADDYWGDDSQEPWMDQYMYKRK